MPPTITGDIITDAVVNLKAALDTQRVTWGVSEVFPYPAHEVGTRGNAIAIEVAPSWIPKLEELASPVVHISHKVALRIWYITNIIRVEKAFEDIYSKLSKIVIYLIEHPSPNGYGELLIDDQGFGPTVEPITGVESEAGQLLAGKFTLIHTYFKAHTQTL